MLKVCPTRGSVCSQIAQVPFCLCSSSAYCSTVKPYRLHLARCCISATFAGLRRSHSRLERTPRDLRLRSDSLPRARAVSRFRSRHFRDAASCDGVQAIQRITSSAWSGDAQICSRIARGTTIQPSDAVPGALIESPWQRKPDRPNISFDGSGIRGSTNGPCCTVVRGNKNVYFPRGIGPTFGTSWSCGLFFPSACPLYPCAITLQSWESSPFDCRYCHTRSHLLRRIGAVCSGFTINQRIPILSRPLAHDGALRATSLAALRPNLKISGQILGATLTVLRPGKYASPRHVYRHREPNDLGPPALQRFHSFL